MICTYCGEERSYPCNNTRDMEDAAIYEARQVCYEELSALGGGERGLRYVDLNREAISRNKTPAPQGTG